MDLYNRFCKRFFAAVIVRLTAQANSRALLQPCVYTRHAVLLNMVIQSAVAKSIVIREIRSYTGTQGGLSPAIHRKEPHPVQPRYQYHKTCGSRRAIVHWTIRTVPQERCPLF